MKKWKICWVSLVDGTEVDHNGFDADALIVKAADILEAYNIALPLISVKVANEGASKWKVYDVGIIDEKVF